ncbi:hypothetical protein BC332_31446 [Capsicum chinense]|nr:hypothetical protein BC332_31446 [Capsicum chinense]
MLLQYLDDKSQIKDAVRMAEIGLTSAWTLDDFKVAIAKYISSPPIIMDDAGLLLEIFDKFVNELKEKERKRQEDKARKDKERKEREKEEKNRRDKSRQERGRTKKDVQASTRLRLTVSRRSKGQEVTEIRNTASGIQVPLMTTLKMRKIIQEVLTDMTVIIRR